jgi:hypothetical protein
MFKDLQSSMYMASRIRPWAAAAALLAVVLISYYMYLGARYWRVTEQAPQLEGQVQELARTLRILQPDDSTLLSDFESSEHELEALVDQYALPEADDFVDLLSRSAEETGILLISVTVDDQKAFASDEIIFQQQPVTLTLQGHAVNIFSFLSLLHERMPVISVAGIRVTELDALPSAQVQLTAFVNPDLGMEDETGAGADTEGQAAK